MPHFRCPGTFGDARVEELKILSAVDQEPDGLLIEPALVGPWKDLLLSREFVTSFSYSYLKGLVHHPEELAVGAGIAGETRLEREVVKAKVEAMNAVYNQERRAVRITHEGRVRLSELKQALRGGREREPFGVLWDGRHWERDLQVALLEARTAAPVAVVYCDMNGLKRINDTAGHDAGDSALKTYFACVASAVADRGETYRLGGDEVLVILPGCDEGEAVKLIRLACSKLMGEAVEGGAPVSIAAGVAVSVDPTVSPVQLRARADKAQYAAKARSKQENPRPSVVALDGREEQVVVAGASITGGPADGDTRRRTGEAKG
jgi:diguanylate cyclase (GGDEF)-like protein